MTTTPGSPVIAARSIVLTDEDGNETTRTALDTEALKRVKDTTA